MIGYKTFEEITLKAAADLSGAQYHLMRISDAETCNLASQATNSGIVGVLQNKPAAADRAATIAYHGISKLVAGGAITAGARLACNGSGRAAAVTSADMCIGQALTAAGADGEVFSAIVHPPIRWSGAA